MVNHTSEPSFKISDCLIGRWENPFAMQIEKSPFAIEPCAGETV